MYEHFFADPQTLLLGGGTGLVFGFLLQKGGVTRFRVILGQFLLKDFTVLKIMLSAILVGSMGIYAMLDMGVEISLHLKDSQLLANALGGILFGVGMALLGYCPGTGVAALGDGSRHAAFGVLGMLVGAALYAEAHPFLKTRILDVVNLGKATLPSVTGFRPLWWILVLVLIAVVAFEILEQKERTEEES